MKYHISKDGRPRPCRSKGPCPLGSNFDSKNGAFKYSEDKNGQDSIMKDKISSKTKFTQDEAADRGIFVNTTTVSWLKNGKDTKTMFYNEKKGEFTKERAKAHREMLDELHKKYENIPSDGKVIFSAGLPGAGKTTVLNMLNETDGIEVDQYATVSSDDFKEMLAERDMIPHIPGLDRMEASTLVHEESSYLADKFLKELSEKNKNVIYDFTCKNPETASERISLLQEDGYEEKDMQFVFVDIPLEVAKDRAIGRYMYGLNNSVDNEDKIGGRFLPPAVLERNISKTGNFSSVNAESLIEVFKRNESKGMPKPIVYDNSGDNRKDPSYKPTKIDFDGFSKKAM